MENFKSAFNKVTKIGFHYHILFIVFLTETTGNKNRKLPTHDGLITLT